MPTEEEELRLLFTTALPIAGIDQFLYPGSSTILVWVNLADRPDLSVLAEQGELNRDKMFICTWFYVMPATPKMGIGLRVKMHEPPHLTLSLVFPFQYDFESLTTLSTEGNMWLLSGPRPSDLGDLLVGDDAAGFLEQVVARSGQGLYVTLAPDLVEELRKQLSSWAALYKKPKAREKRRVKRKKKRN
jgi:hypothetical protein